MSNFCSVNSSGLSRVLWCFPPFLTAFTSFCLPIYLWCCFNLDASGCFPFMESDSLLIRLKHSRATSRILDLEEISSICNNDIANAQKLFTSQRKHDWFLPMVKQQNYKLHFAYMYTIWLTWLRGCLLHSLYLQKLLCVRVQLLNPSRLTGLYSRDAIDITDSTKVLFLCLCLLVHYLQT